jgi:glycine amidinotransferase
MTQTNSPIVSVYTEWDPLEEVIVGVVSGGAVPEWHVTLQATMPEDQWQFYQQNGGKPFDPEKIRLANQDLAEFVHILESEGVTVKRPDEINFARPYQTMDWQVPSGLYAAMPRDILLVFGDLLIECPLAWRSRYYEVNAYRNLLKDYFRQGARWVAAPRPELKDEFYNYDYQEPASPAELKYVINELEPTFDAADFIRCGRDIFCQRSHVTNNMGIEWLRRLLGDTYTIHVLEVEDTHPMHIDATFMPLAPGKLLINQERLKKLPPMFKDWDVFTAPRPCMSDRHTLYMTSKWINMNIIMLDTERVVVERQEESIIQAFKDWGFKPIPCSFQNFNTFGGSFHCATLDVRRRGELTSYF